ncbi:MAG: hypothetical protein ABWY78_06635, partial [Microvirga sp.]
MARGLVPEACPAPGQRPAAACAASEACRRAVGTRTEEPEAGQWPVAAPSGQELGREWRTEWQLAQASVRAQAPPAGQHRAHPAAPVGREPAGPAHRPRVRGPWARAGRR